MPLPTPDIGKLQLSGIGQILAGGKLRIPPYQRAYAWKKQHVRTLLGDLSKAIGTDEPQYFLGIVAIAERDEWCRDVIAGQHRLVTSTILIAAIRDFFYSRHDQERYEAIEHRYLYECNPDAAEPTPKLILQDHDHGFFEKRVLSRPGSVGRDVAPSRKSQDRIALAAEIVASHVTDLARSRDDPCQTLLDWLEFLTSRAVVVVVRTPDHPSGIIDFKTVRERGVGTRVADSVRTHLFQRAGGRFAEVKHCWTSMFRAIEATGDDGDVADYVLQLWSSWNGPTRLADLPARLKQTTSGEQDAADFARLLSRSARSYSAIISPADPLWDRFGSNARACVTALNVLDAEWLRPILLAALQMFSVSQISESLEALVSGAVRHLMAGSDGRLATKPFCDCARDIWTGSVKDARGLAVRLSRIVVPDNEFKELFATRTVSRPPVARYYLHRLESRVGGTAHIRLRPSDGDDVNLEHVVPRNPADGWDHLGPPTHQRYCWRLGNLALLDSAANSWVANKPFEFKRRIYAGSGFRLTRMISRYDRWTAAQIEERQRFLAELAVEAWPVGV